MACLSVLFSIDEKAVSKLRAFTSDEGRLEFLQEEIEVEVMSRETGEYGAGILTNGKLDWANGASPLCYVVLGIEQLNAER